MNTSHSLLFAALLLLATENHAGSPGNCADEERNAACAESTPGGLPGSGPEPARLLSDGGDLDPYAPVSAWAVCPPQPAQGFFPRSTGAREETATSLTGDLANMTADGTYTLIGAAEAERADQRIQADRLIYYKPGSVADVEGQVRYDEPDMTVTASHGKIWLDEDRAEFYDTRFRFYERHARGKAEAAWLLEPGLTSYRDATYTTCPDASNVWLLRSRNVTLNHDDGIGTARHAHLRIKDVPVLYTPYISFPIDDRRITGFLVPSFGSSDNSGFEFRVPYYFNLAPNYDATLTPRYLQDRGAQITTEFRHLTENQRSLLNVEYLHQDEIAEQDRSRITLRNTSRFGKHLAVNVDYDRVSDKDYLNDLGDTLSLASITHLQRTIRADYSTAWWTAGLSVDDYQTVDSTIAAADRPYERMPRLTFSGISPMNPFGLFMGVESEAVHFDQDSRVTGSRIDLFPSIRLPVQRAAFEITPKIGLRYTAYGLDQQPAEQPETPTRTTPLFSLDNTLFLERNLRIGSRSYLQTLEPRLYYLYVKGQNQDDLPLFDTSEPTFSYQELFEENRFDGTDRMGDANQLALAATTRFMDPGTGQEKFRASAGQLFYFQNRNVTLGNTQPQDEKASDIAGEMDVSFSRAWNGKADVVWSPGDRQTERANARIQYNPGFRKIANLSYRYRNSSQDQIDASILWPLSPAWHVLGRWYYDIDNSQKLETMAGIEYDSCCWGVRLVAREYLDNDGTETNRAVMFQFVLKGLGHIGSNIESLLEDGILGYTERPED
ncbi:MAG: LPS assembly protein LptD [Thiogranum sp.]|nr:LPS assembly protein LptD [Thiogranum sp.]